MTKTIHGVVRGKYIELQDDLGLIDGQVVELTVQAIPTPAMNGTVQSVDQLNERFRLSRQLRHLRR